MNLPEYCCLMCRQSLKEQVKRNIKRFPADFMFELTKNEKDELVANCDRLAGKPFIFQPNEVRRDFI
jgi:hypothetical protein